MLCATLHVGVPVVRRFIGDYLDLLDRRIGQIDHDLQHDELAAASIALLSLTASSVMLGANGVAETADQLRRYALSADHKPEGIAEGQRILHDQAAQEQLRLRRIWSVAK